MSSSRMGKVETFLLLALLYLYYFDRIFYLKMPTKDYPFLRYCTPKPLRLPSLLYAPRHFT